MLAQNTTIIAEGENFYCRAFCRLWIPDELTPGIEIAPKIWAGRGLPVIPGEHWEKWLGEIPFREIRSGLVITATATQPRLGYVVDEELKRRLDHLAYGLILQVVPDYRESFLIAGANEAAHPEVRQFGRARVFYPARNLKPLRIGQSELARASALASKLKVVDKKGADWRRLRRSLDALTKGSAEPHLQDERIHQFVRALEGLILPDIGNTEKQFVHRLLTFAHANSKTRNSLEEIFRISSKVEHLHNALDALPDEPTVEAKENLLYRRARQIDCLARFAISRVIERDDLREIFRTETSISDFWKKRDDERVNLWGNRLDLELIT